MAEPPQPVPTPQSRAERRAEVARAAAVAAAPHLVPVEEGYLEVPVARLPHATLLYRVDNGRILSELEAVAAERGATLSAFSATEGEVETQRLLHDLLIEKATDPTAPILRELERHARQTEPLLIQSDGVVVNGNRRLAAMRALLARDPERYAAFAEMRAAVLPETIGRDAVEFIEAALQMAPELKLDYGWVNRRLKLRAHAADMPRDRIAAAWRFADERWIDVELDELALAERWLAWIGRPGDHARLAAEETRFTALRERLDALGQRHVAELWRLIGFAMIAAADTLETPIEHVFPFAKPVPAAVVHWTLRALAEDRGLVAAQTGGESAQVDAALAARLAPTLDDPARAETVARAALAHMDRLRADEGQLLGPTRALAHMRRAREALAGVDPADATPALRRRLRSEHAALEAALAALGAEEGVGPKALLARLRDAVGGAKR